MFEVATPLHPGSSEQSGVCLSAGHRLWISWERARTLVGKTGWGGAVTPHSEGKLR